MNNLKRNASLVVNFLVRNLRILNLLLNINLDVSTFLENFTSLTIKTRDFQTTQCNLNKISFKINFDVLIFNKLDVKEKIEFWPQPFHDINAFLAKIFFLPIFKTIC